MHPHYFFVYTINVSSLFIKVEALYQETVEVGEKDNNGVIPFASRNGSNKLSYSVPTVDVNISGIRG